MKPKPKNCSEADCVGTIVIRGLCRRHYDRQRGAGTNGNRYVTRTQAERQAVKRGGVETPCIDLIAAIIRCAEGPNEPVPTLDGACKSLPPRLFDGATEEDIAVATAACESCPVLSACRAWVLSDESGITTGVVGGLVLDVPARQ